MHYIQYIVLARIDTILIPIVIPASIRIARRLLAANHSLMSSMLAGLEYFRDPLVPGCTLFGSTRVEDDEPCLDALKGNLVRKHVNNNLLAFVIATREEML